MERQHFQIEMGTWHRLKSEVWACKECESGCCWLLQYSAWNYLRQPLLEAMGDVGKTSLQKTMETEQPI